MISLAPPHASGCLKEEHGLRATVACMAKSHRIEYLDWQSPDSDYSFTTVLLVITIWHRCHQRYSIQEHRLYSLVGGKNKSHCCTALTARVGYVHPRTSLREWMGDPFIRVQILQRPLLPETLSTGHHSEMRTRYSRCLGLLGIVRSVSDHSERNSKMSYRTRRNPKDGNSKDRDLVMLV
jgi:hypothetical protein